VPVGTRSVTAPAAATRQSTKRGSGIPHPFAAPSYLVYAHQLSISIGQAIRDLELIAKALDPADMLNRIELLPYS
jgi:hypothetical protein